MGYSANAPLDQLFRPGPLEDSCRRITRRVIEDVEDGARRRTPVAKPPEGMGRDQFSGARGRAPGTLKASWRKTDVDRSVAPSGAPRFSAEAYTEDPVGPHVEYETMPHVIRPRVDRAPASVRTTGHPRLPGSDPRARLRFWAGGREVFAAEVQHPGTRGVHMMRDSLAEADSTWEARVGDEEVTRWAREQAELVR